MIRIELEGTGALISALKAKPAETRLALIAALYGACQFVRNAAVNGLRKGPKTGRVYKRGGVFHRASAPGEYPASDSGTLMGRIDSEVNEATLVGEVGTNVVYGKYLEFKDPAKGGRPWLSRAWSEAQPKVEAALLAAIQRVFPADRTVTRL